MWPTWVWIGCAWLIVRLPLSTITQLGRWLGRGGYRFSHTRRKVTLTNLRLCFPELDENEHITMAREVFEQVAIGALELMLTWLNPRRNLRDRITVKGDEHLKAAIATGRGVIVLGGHFAVMDTIAAALSAYPQVDVMYRVNKDPVLEWLQVRGRRQYFDGVIERSDTRETLRRLKAGRAIWYAADQDYGPKHSVFVPFFSVPTATITATSKLARFNQSPVLMMIQQRCTRTLTWTLEFTPVLENFPSGDEVDDAARVNALLEEVIRRDPTQYLWLHKRFKTRPPGEPSLY